MLKTATAMFIVLKASQLLVRSFAAIWVAEDRCMVKKFEDTVAKICHFVISGVIERGFREFVMSQE